MEGQYTATLPLRLTRADAVLHLDFPRLLCVSRVLKRLLFSEQRPDLPPGCPECLDPSFLAYVWRSHDRWRDSMPELLEEAASRLPVGRLRDPVQVERFLPALSQPRGLTGSGERGGRPAACREESSGPSSSSAACSLPWPRSLWDSPPGPSRPPHRWPSAGPGTALRSRRPSSSPRCPATESFRRRRPGRFAAVTGRGRSGRDSVLWRLAVRGLPGGKSRLIPAQCIFVGPPGGEDLRIRP